MMPIDQLTGVLQVRPGRQRPAALSGERPDWAAKLARGRAASALPDTLAAIFSLCGEAHRLCARAAVGAALGRAHTAGEAARPLRAETVREHLRRMLLDWPGRLVPAPSHDAQCALASCPAFRAGVDDATLARWVEQQLVGRPLAGWLDDWERGSAAAWVRWCAEGTGWLPRLMRDVQGFADTPLTPCAPLFAHAATDGVRRLADALRDDPTFTRHPRILGACAETGSWTRLNDTSPMPHSAWQRLAARVAELVRLLLPDAPARTGTQWLRSGALPLASGEGVAWVEMARGLLVHHVVLDGGQGDARVEHCRVLAPTEWNFHPDGAVAQALEALPDDGSPDTLRRVGALMAAYDPCVRYELPDRHEESTHA
jgi:hypothetical protein